MLRLEASKKGSVVRVSQQNYLVTVRKRLCMLLKKLLALSATNTARKAPVCRNKTCGFQWLNGDGKEALCS